MKKHLTYHFKEDGAYTSQGWLTIYWILTFDDSNLVARKAFLSKQAAIDYQKTEELAQELADFA